MPNDSNLVKSSEIINILEAKPNMRFGTTFLSTEYRKYAVKGESIMDKATGEIFTKRKDDGRVVSFFQNKKYIHDLLLELRVLLVNNPDFYYPNESESAYYISRDHDLVYMNGETLNDIYENNTVFDTSSDESYNHIQFKISTGSNGFFIRLMSRDTDKATISFISSRYNQLVKNYKGIVYDIIKEREKFNTIEKWEDSDAILNYKMSISHGSTTKSYTVTDYIRVNEETCVLLPMDMINSDFEDGYDSINIEILSFEYAKLHFMMENYDVLDVINFKKDLSKFQYLDNHIYINYCNICCFIDGSTDVSLLGNETIIAFIDVPYMRRYLMKMSKLTDGSDVITSSARPLDDVWPVNGLWIERVRDATSSGLTVDRGSETNISRLETYLASDTASHTDTVFSTNIYDSEAVYVSDESEN